MCLSCSLRFQPTYLFDVRSLPWEQGLSSSFKRSERSKRRAAQTPNAQAWHTPSGGLYLGRKPYLWVSCVPVPSARPGGIVMSPSPTKRVRRGRHSDGRAHPLSHPSVLVGEPRTRPLRGPICFREVSPLLLRLEQHRLRWHLIYPVKTYIYLKKKALTKQAQSGTIYL